MKESPYLDENGFLLEKLRTIPFLGGLGTKYIKNILRKSKLRKYDDQEAITLENTEDPWIYILFSGAARVTKNGKELTQMSEVGTTFGEVAVLDGKPRSASVQAIGPTVCLAIDASVMKEGTDPFEQAVFVSMLYKIFSEVMASRLRRKDDELEKASSELDRARAELVKLKKDLPRLRQVDEEFSKVRLELDNLKRTVAKRWLLVDDGSK